MNNFLNTSIYNKRWLQILVIFFLLFIASCGDSKKKDVDYNEGLSTFDALEYPNKKISDGPYIFFKDGETIIKWMQEDEVVEKVITPKNVSLIENNFGFKLKYEWLKPHSNEIDYKQEFKDVDRIISISDIHGQYKMFVKMLREYNIIDEDNNWIFGDGHLMIVGDIFDRGPQVNEALWLVFKLEHQALENGGHVHYLMGNHEEMILNNDNRYVNEKYLATAKHMGVEHGQLYAENTLIGQWLRTKPLIIQINDILFVHAGISPEFIDRGFTAEKVNDLFINQLLGKTGEEITQDSVLKFLRGSNGPIWYRGYFKYKDIAMKDIDRILNYFNKKAIVVGHTSQNSIVSLFRNKIFGIDASIKNGKYGEVLIYDKGNFYRGTIKMSVPFSRSASYN